MQGIELSGGVSPQPDAQGLHTIALSRMRWDPRTCAYVQRRTEQGLSKKDIMRCLKRHIAREIYRALIDDLHIRQGRTPGSPINLAKAA